MQSWASLGFATLAMLFLSAQINVFASRIASPGALYIYVNEGLGPFAGVITGWSLMIAYAVLSATCVTEVAITGSRRCSPRRSVCRNPSAFTRVLPLPGFASPGGLRNGTSGFRRAYRLRSRARRLFSFSRCSPCTLSAREPSTRSRYQLSLKGTTFEQFRSGLVFAVLLLPSAFESACDLGIEAKRPKILIPRAAVTLSVIIVGLFFVVGSYGVVDAFPWPRPAGARKRRRW